MSDRWWDDMVKKEESNPRLLDIMMADLKWRGRLSYVEDVLFGRDKKVKRDNKALIVMIVFFTFCIGMVLGMLIYRVLSSLF